MKPADTRFGPLILPFLLLATFIVAVTLGAITYTVRQQKTNAVERLQTIAELKVNQIESWFQERRGNAQFAHSSRYYAKLYQHWRDTDDTSSYQQLRQRLEIFREVYRYQNVFLLDNRGQVALAAGDMPTSVTPELRTTVQRAIAEGRVLHTDLYRSEGERPAVHLDVVSPLLKVDDQPVPAIIFRVDPTAVLYPMIQSWPFPSASGEILIFRRDGDQVLYFNELRHRSDTALTLRLPVAEPRLLAARVLRGEAPLGSAVEGFDYRRVPAVGVAKAIPGSDWFLIAKLDKDELYAPAQRDAVWIALVGAMALFVAAIATFFTRQRRELRLSRASTSSRRRSCKPCNNSPASAAGCAP